MVSWRWSTKNSRRTCSSSWARAAASRRISAWGSLMVPMRLRQVPRVIVGFPRWRDHGAASACSRRIAVRLPRCMIAIRLRCAVPLRLAVL